MDSFDDFAMMGPTNYTHEVQMKSLELHRLKSILWKTMNDPIIGFDEINSNLATAKKFRN